MRISKEKIIECWNKDDCEWVVHATKEQIESLVDSDKLPYTALMEWQDWKDYVSEGDWQSDLGI